MPIYNETKNVSLNLPSELIARIQIASILSSEDPNHPRPYQNLIRDALENAFRAQPSAKTEIPPCWLPSPKKTPKNAQKKTQKKATKPKGKK